MTRAKHSPPRRKIVIVDDDVLIRETVRLALEHAGFAVTVVEQSTEAVEKVKEVRPDLVILDLYMPGRDGRELARTLKSDPETAATPIILFTGSSEAVDVVTGLQSGAVEYIAKPVDGEVLISKIRHILKLGAAPKVKKK